MKGEECGAEQSRERKEFNSLCGENNRNVGTYN
jgi:hypothetical protein